MTEVRDATGDDVPHIAEIYRHWVRHGTGTFDLHPPDESEVRAHHRDVVDRGLPFLVAELDGTVVGYAYAVQFRPRPGYARTVEESVYIHPDHRARGVGRALLTELIARCALLDKLQMIAVIGDSENAASIRLHEAMGFVHVGVLREVGYKFGRFRDCVLMQRALTR